MKDILLLLQGFMFQSLFAYIWFQWGYKSREKKYKSAVGNHFYCGEDLSVVVTKKKDRYEVRIINLKFVDLIN